MAKVTVIIPKGKYENSDAVDNVISYMVREGNVKAVGGIGVFPLHYQSVIEQYHIVKRYYGQTRGKQIFHIVFSLEKSLFFSVEDLTKLAAMIGQFWGRERQVFYSVHDDTNHLHIHIAINTVSFLDGTQCGFFPIDDIRAYVEQCVDKLADEKWFRKKEAVELIPLFQKI